ncbi:adenylosuccinate lyase family protein (plasmid) [Paracoccus methylovorus]|uniref:Adenylosuccinate lyase family protein n=1 Tax=Paracoccus methylovorus TaxID=2812658 RepID=A0ABX7JL41_9RHOB|nr:adenylosuccinate lyase family protein [Paracoccus methylovorus]QRZ14524.1 adenylosuccinate lyase family protein [Paracoccus methylovorus]
MPAAAADSALYRSLFSDDDTAALFTDSAEIRAMLLVEGALARVQGGLGIIPQTAAAFIDRSSREVQIDPAALAAETATNGVPVPALVAAFRKGMGAPDHAQYLHWGATSQDIMDTGQALRLRRLTAIWDERLGQLAAALGRLARQYADLPMAARSYGQVATPTSFGAVVAGWGHPLLRHRARLATLAPELATVSLGGAAGTLSVMDGQGPAVRAGLAEALGLRDPGHSWHAERDSIGAFAAWMAGLCASLGKMGEDLILMVQSGIGEIRIEGAGGSSTMPQKQNPVGASVLVALARQSVALSSALQGAGIHRQQRDGAAWFVEWLSLPQLCISTGRALALALDLSQRIAPDAQAMARGLDDGSGLIHAEALTFALARHLPRPEAQARIKAICAEVQSSGQPLPALVARDFPDLDLSGIGGLGTAPDEARAFADAAGA